MKLPRRNFLRLAAGAAALPFAPHVARAQAYPARPVRIVVPFPPGGGTDLFARLIAQWLTDRLGQSFIIENRPGAGANIGTEVVVKSPPDGYTLLLAFSSNAINTTLYDKLNFVFLRDITPVAGIVRLPMLVQVNASLPVKTLPEFIAYAKGNPGRVSMASAGIGTPSHVGGELLKLMAGIKMLHVPYRGSGPALNDLLGGQVQVLMVNPGASIEHNRAGKLRALAITSSTRSEVLPDIPAVAEFVPGYEAILFYGLAAPKGTPAEIVSLLNKEVNAALADPQIKARLAALDGEVLILSPDGFGKLLADETEKWAKVVKLAGAKAN